MRRRQMLIASGTVVAATATGVMSQPSGDNALLTVAREPGSATESSTATETILSGTVHETTVFERDAPRDGPTAMIFGGVHGDERTGIEVARDTTEWYPDAGTLVVVPETNRIAVDENTREGPEGDLNRHFPAGKEPVSDLARGIWDAVERYDPDVVLDLHRSLGIAGVHQQYVGQAVYHSSDSYGDELASYLNDVAVPWYMPLHRISARRTHSGGPLLFQKAIRDLDATGYLFETTDFMLDRDTRNEHTRLAAAKTLALHGLLEVGNN
ncbi:succinylglutamate desuccinylase/aspartoacylase family protein [Natrinema halophilum]|uniref:Succinylglutamate desuccinylase/aspartoacylase family protein n=1 Tax=Natrinema halophilum TaxID=1699371 RepID=A0A7D5KR56_9EURY|nr:succinylglutamate desuccinylase/aspartoacylase family protein [Natrinema halophilum]QLG48104.1 succinylglutamate desuccinylase/aspartoacylase family protein [Natrinema halophilum]